MLTEKELLNSKFWYDYKEYQNDKFNLSCVFYTKISLDRNLLKFPYPPNMGFEDNMTFLGDFEEFFFTLNDVHCVNIENFEDEYVKLMVHKGIISDVKSKKHLRLFMQEDNKFYVLLNNVNHISISAISLGLDTKKYKYIDEIDSAIEKKFEYAFSLDLGYLSKEITNLGNGMRVLSVLYLPFFRKQDAFFSVKQKLLHRGFKLEEFNPNSDGFERDLFILYNNANFEMKEEKLLESFTENVRLIEDIEIKAREKLYKERKDYFEDLVYRAWGILENNVLIEKKEFLELVGILLVGFSVGIRAEFEIQAKIISTLFDITDYKLEQCKNFEEEFKNFEFSKIRSILIKKALCI